MVSTGSWNFQVNEFFPTGLIITSDETAQTYKEIFESLETTFEYLMADGASAITKAKMEVWKPDVIKILENGTEIDKQRGMCYPHVQRNVQKKLKTIAEFEKEILDDIKHIQISAIVSCILYELIANILRSLL